MASRVLPGSYRRREPEHTALHQLVREHLETFLEAAPLNLEIGIGSKIEAAISLDHDDLSRQHLAIQPHLDEILASADGVSPLVAAIPVEAALARRHETAV